MGSNSASAYFINTIYPLIKDCAKKGLHRGASLAKYYTKEKAKSNVQKIVYGAYTPKVYKRRKNNGGLISAENFIFTDERFNLEDIMVNNDNVIRVSFFATFDNITKTNGFMKEKTSGERDKRYLAPIIEYGNPNSNAPYSRPRPFMEKTENYINGNNGEDREKIYNLLVTNIQNELYLRMNI